MSADAKKWPLPVNDAISAVIPDPDGDDRPVEIDLVKGPARIR